MKRFALLCPLILSVLSAPALAHPPESEKIALASTQPIAITANALPHALPRPVIAALDLSPLNGPATAIVALALLAALTAVRVRRNGMLKVPFREVYCDTVGAWLRATLWCHAVIKIWPHLIDVGAVADIELKDKSEFLRQWDFKFRAVEAERSLGAN